MARRRRQPRVHLIASLGGHLELLVHVREAYRDFDRVWITSPGVRADGLRAEGETVQELPRLDRGTLSVSTVLAGIKLALRERPRLVVTTGAGLAVPFSLVARLLGSRLVMVETMTRVTSASITGRLLGAVGNNLIVQWPEAAARTKKAEACAPILLEGVTTVGTSEGTGTFVTVGSHDEAFPRLLDGVAKAAAAGILPSPVFVQTGVGTLEADGIETRDFISREEFTTRVEEAQVIVTHGGAGALASVARAGKRPVVLARSVALGEHLDDHQQELVDKFKELDLVVLVEVGSDITAADVARAQQPIELSAEVGSLPSLRDRLAAIARP